MAKRKRRQTKRERKRTRSPGDLARAYHETGHAVVALLNKQRIQLVTIEPDGDLIGSCQTEVEEGSAGSSFRARLQVLIAGIQTEVIAQVDGRIQKDTSLGFRGDLSEAMNLIRSNLQMSDEVECESVLYEESEKVSAMIRRYWKDVESIAAALIKHRTLTGEQLAAIVTSISTRS